MRFLVTLSFVACGSVLAQYFDDYFPNSHVDRNTNYAEQDPYVQALEDTIVYMQRRHEDELTILRRDMETIQDLVWTGGLDRRTEFFNIHVPEHSTGNLVPIRQRVPVLIDTKDKDKGKGDQKKGDKGDKGDKKKGGKR